MTNKVTILQASFGILLVTMIACGPTAVEPVEPSEQAKAYARRVCESAEACECFTDLES